MNNKKIIRHIAVAFTAVCYFGCSTPALLKRTENKTTPAQFPRQRDTVSVAKIPYSKFFTDPNLTLLIDSALKNNQEFNIVMQEINIAKNEIRARKGEYLPFLGIGAGAGVEKTSRYTRNGTVEANHDIIEGKEFPEPLPDFVAQARLSWEVDIWKRLRNAKTAALHRYLSSVEGRNFMKTQLIAEIASSYFELMALDNQLDILRQNIRIQQNALEIVKLEKASAKTTELAVRKFEAEVLKNQGRQYGIMQQIVETENRINFLVGRFPQPVARSSAGFTQLRPDSVSAGLPSQLLFNRPDIRRAEQELIAAKLDVRVARANFYPALRLDAAIGLQAFNPAYLAKMPQSLMYSLAGDLMAPLINRNAIKANYYSASSRQVQSIYNYERSILRAHIEVVNQLANTSNLARSFELQSQQVQALVSSIDISTTLFKSARADYMEVLMTQRDALEARFDLIETKRQQMNALVNIYQALGGGWQ
jgi:multidrug efflux system outer membrane protein